MHMRLIMALCSGLLILILSVVNAHSLESCHDDTTTCHQAADQHDSQSPSKSDHSHCHGGHLHLCCSLFMPTQHALTMAGGVPVTGTLASTDSALPRSYLSEVLRPPSA